MSDDTSALLSDILELPPSEREEVAAALWDSLNLESGIEESSETDLIAETARRREELLSGAVRPLTHDELKRQLGK